MDTILDVFVEPVVSSDQFQQIYREMIAFIRKNLTVDHDYGIVPGIAKPFLWQPGAEKLLKFFGLEFTWEPITTIEDFFGQDHEGEPFFYYSFKGSILKHGHVIVQSIGSCNSWEKKFRFRYQKRVCPACGEETIIKGRQEFGGGWVCFAKKGGCSAKFADNDPIIINQPIGLINNPDPFDQVNTCQKMGLKRTLVGGVLVACIAHEFFAFGIDDKDIEGSK